MRLAAVVLLALVLGGCAGFGGGPRAYPPTGIDGLTIPTPSPRGSDFVAVVDNPWFPLRVGHRWVYGVSQPAGTRVVTVTGRGRVDGVSTTRVTVRSSTGETVDDYAQDRSGNVWWFGHHGGGDGDPSVDWAAGVDGAQAGLVMPAHPRLGDGFRMALKEGRAEDLAEVVAVSPTEVTIDVSSPLEPGAVTRLTYRRGGLTSRIVAATGEIDTLR